MHLTPRCASLRGVELRDVHPTAESSSAVCFPPRSRAPPCEFHCESQALQCALHHGVNCTKFLKKLRSVHHTVESSSTVCFPPWSQTLRCSSHGRVKLRGVHPTAESSSAVCITPPSQTAHCRVKI